MTLKRLLLFGFFCSYILFSNAQQLTTTQGTVINTSTNRLSVYAKPAMALPGRLFRNVTFALSLPDQGVNNPTVTVDTNYIPNLDWQALAPQVLPNGRVYYTFLGNDNGLPTTTSWTTGNNKVATFSFAFPGPNNLNAAQLNDETPSGGPNGQMFWYVEIINVTSGDITDYNNKFYGTATNPPTNNLNSPSFVAVQTVSLLPLIFKDFNVAKQGNNNALLSWSTSTEQDVSHFVLQRSLSETSGWTSFAEVKATGNSNTTTKYSHSDLNVYDGRQATKLVFYRILSVDLDGRQSAFPIRSLRFTATGTKVITLHPNPVVRKGFYLSIPLFNPSDNLIRLHLVNRQGQIIHAREISTAVASNYYYSVETPGIIAGEYMLQIFYNGDLLETKKVIVAR